MLAQLIALLMSLEGFSTCSYHDRTHHTIGYGTRAAAGTCISEKEAYRQLSKIASIHLKAAKKLPNLNENQQIALASFRFNIGQTAFRDSQLVKYVKEGKLELAAKEFDKWIYSGGKKLNGLVKRRNVERRLFEGIKK